MFEWIGSFFSDPPVYPYGDICEVDTTGASRITARADGKSCTGVSASHAMANDDLPYIMDYKNKIINAAKEKKVQPSVVAAIISRETRGGRGEGLSSDGKGDNGYAFGLMQIDKRWHKRVSGEWNSQKHIEQGIGILLGCYSDIENKFPNWTKNQKLKGALAAYNKGTRDMASTYKKVDDHTTNGDYANDVTARAQYFEKHGFKL